MKNQSKEAKEGSKLGRKEGINEAKKRRYKEGKDVREGRTERSQGREEKKKERATEARKLRKEVSKEVREDGS